MRSKFNNIKTTVDNIVFDSKREADLYQSLKALQRAGTIRGLEWQVPFPLSTVNVKTQQTETVSTYVADFVCQDLDGRTCVYDAKGVRTPVYKIKKKHFELQYGLRIIEV